nr:hypothetical protein [Candidatus Woesebacteria bacterium]
SQWSTPVLQFLLQEFGQLAQNVSSPIPHLLLELKCLEIIARAQKKQADAPATSASSHSDHGGNTSSSDQTRKASQSPAKSKQSDTVSKPIKKQLESTVTSDLQLGDGKTLCDRWAELVKQVATANASLAALLQSAQPITGSTGFVTIRVFYTFHREQIMNQKSQSLMQGIIRELCGGTLSLNVEVISAEQAAPALTTSGPSLEGSGSESLATVASSILM